MTKLYTRTGDTGKSTLFDGRRYRKSSLCFEVLGSLDELNAAIGLANSFVDDKALSIKLDELQSDLIRLSSQLAGAQNTPDADVIERYERWIDNYQQNLEPLAEFIKPGGNPASAALHLARTLSRRAERRLVQLGEHEKVELLHYQHLNRLSDVLFVMAQFVNQHSKYSINQDV